MDTGQTREAAAAKRVTNGQESKGQRVEVYSGGARQDKLAWSAHGADNAAGAPLPTSADGKWGPGEEHAATVVRGWIHHAAKEGRDSWDVRPLPGSESDSGEGEETAGCQPSLGVEVPCAAYTAAERRYMNGEGRLEDIHPFVCPRCDPTGPQHDFGQGCDLCAVLPIAELNRQHRELFREHGGLYLCPPHGGPGGQERTPMRA
ncbi:hypothetical protein B484DRAFT_408418 [Ochromonadaceae sp. CCMP2298]|nr:hypothetical protein B484DRAFT_408418 [Ochromonadaceae sp. CCMP2298]